MIEMRMQTIRLRFFGKKERRRTNLQRLFQNFSHGKTSVKIRLFFALRLLFLCGAHERGEQRMCRIGTGFEFRMELHPDKERMFGKFHRLYESAVGRSSADLHTALFENFAVIVIEFVSVPMPFGKKRLFIVPALTAHG